MRRKAVGTRGKDIILNIEHYFPVQKLDAYREAR